MTCNQCLMTLWGYFIINLPNIVGIAGRSRSRSPRRRDRESLDRERRRDKEKYRYEDEDKRYRNGTSRFEHSERTRWDVGERERGRSVVGIHPLYSAMPSANICTDLTGLMNGTLYIRTVPHQGEAAVARRPIVVNENGKNRL